MAHSLVDAVAVLQRGGVPMELLGQAVKIRKASQQVLLTGLPQLGVTHKTLHQVQPIHTKFNVEGRRTAAEVFDLVFLSTIIALPFLYSGFVH